MYRIILSFSNFGVLPNIARLKKITVLCNVTKTLYQNSFISK